MSQDEDIIKKLAVLDGKIGNCRKDKTKTRADLAELQILHRKLTAQIGVKSKVKLTIDDSSQLVEDKGRKIDKEEPKKDRRNFFKGP